MGANLKIESIQPTLTGAVSLGRLVEPTERGWRVHVAGAVHNVSVDDAVDPPELHSQIPEGFAGPLHPADENRADAAAWLDRLPLIRDFRTAVAG